MTTNRTGPALQLLAEIEKWCHRTGTAESVIGHVLFLHPGFVGMVRKRLTVTEKSEDAAREFLRNHPDGWMGELPKTHANPNRKALRTGQFVNTTRMSGDEIAARRIEREACPWCAVRTDIGCRHFPRAA